MLGSRPEGSGFQLSLHPEFFQTLEFMTPSAQPFSPVFPMAGKAGFFQVLEGKPAASQLFLRSGKISLPARRFSGSSYTETIMRRCFLFVVGFVAVSVAAPFSHAVELTAREEAYLESRGREIRVALPGNYVPLSFVGEKGEFEGVMPDFLRWFGDRADVNFKFFVATPSQAKQGVAEGVYDVVGIYSPSLKQDAAIACSAVVLDVPLGIFVPDSSSIQMLSDLEGKILAYQGKSVGRLLDSLRLDFGKVEYHQLSDMLDSVEYGETDAAVYSELPILNYVHAGKTAEMYRQVGDYLYTNKICVGVSSANEMLLSLLNQGVAAAQDEGVIRWIERRWAGGSYTSFLLVMEKYSHYLIMGVGGLLLAVLLFWVWDVRL
ncbi:MAG: transporter substrate-binding domain-containing protein, partial [Kiritimatiellales bacterium]|nr:transporter substrate-binding domain-containing protein [Kiritimatiellales bacterium]